MTMKTRACAIGFLVVLAMPPLAANAQTARKSDMLMRNPPKRMAMHMSDRRMSERLGYKKVSSLVNFPPFFPGIGVVYVQPKTLPNGPYRAFDRRGRLSSTIYMLPIEDIENRKKFDLAGIAGKGDHVTFYFNSGHPGLDKPHYHIHIWHVSKKGEERVANSEQREVRYFAVLP
jgi:hypothetical protein